ncbi:MAG TPA: ABC transporter permease [Anaerolineae bacterium]
MPSPRWRKVLRDLWGNKTRTLLVVLSIAVGVFAIGMVSGTQVLLSRGLTENYLATNPPSAMLFTDPFDDDQVQVVRKMPGVQEAEGVRRLAVRVQAGPDPSRGDAAQSHGDAAQSRGDAAQWQTLVLYAVPDFSHIRIGKFKPFGGAWPPPKRELLTERSSLSSAQAHVGDPLLIETPDGKRHDMRIAGLAYDPSKLPPTFTGGVGFGYITLDTLEWLGEPRTFNQLNIVSAGNALDKDHNSEVANQVRDKLEQGGLRVYSVYVPPPGKHPADSAVQALLLLLDALGVLSLIASGFLIVNTISATLAQQIRQIGVMKAIGARRVQVTAIYLGMVLAYGLLALAIAMPLAVLGAQALSAYFANLINTDLTFSGMPSEVNALEIAVGLLVPLVASLVPVLSGTRVTVREAISNYGLNAGQAGGIVDWVLERVPGMSRPFLLSLRNTFRRKGRLALTLTTLTLGGAIFVAVMSVRGSFGLTLDDVFKFWGYDVEVDFGQPYLADAAKQQAGQIPGVEYVEAWAFGSVRRVRPDGTESDNLNVNAPPTPTGVVHPSVLQGRWLLPDDENAVVVNTDLLKNEPDIKVGDDLDLKIDTEHTHWRVVGIIRSSLSGPRIFANYPYFSRVDHSAGHAGAIFIVTDRHDNATQTQAARALEERFKQTGWRVGFTDTTFNARQRSDAQVNILVTFLMIMALLLAFVGGLGLMGTMSLNVVERTREIGVLRAIGASNGAVLSILMGEGILIGAISWVLGVIVAFPLSQFLSVAVGNAFVNTPLDYVFAVDGALVWLGFVLILSALASFLPARSASRLTVREVLAYE